MSNMFHTSVGDVELLVETTPTPGMEPTMGPPGRAAEQTGAFSKAQDVIIGVALATAQVIEKTTAQNACPDHVEVEFNLRFSPTGHVVMTRKSGEGVLASTARLR